MGVTTGGVGIGDALPGRTETTNAAAAVAEAESPTVKYGRNGYLKIHAPELTANPLIRPVWLRESPEGSDPAGTDHV
jgi:hypothetical protein